MTEAEYGEAVTRDDLYLSQSNHTMEMLYVATDPTGMEPEYVCLLTNMFPKGSDHSHFVYESGSHDLVQLSIEFTASKYMSAQINYIGTLALARYNILRNYLNMYSGYNKELIGKRIQVPNITNWMDYGDGYTYDKAFGPQASSLKSNPNPSTASESVVTSNWANA